MAFWSDITLEEPLRQYRWYIEFGGTTKLDDVKYALKKADKPKAKIGEITHKYLNHYFYYPGRLEWEAINITFAGVKAADERLYKIFTEAGYQWPANADARKTISKAGFSTNLGNTVKLIQVNPEGTPMETWKLTNTFFTSVQFGSLDYGSDEIVEIQCTMRYDYAALEGTAPAAGTANATTNGTAPAAGTANATTNGTANGGGGRRAES